ncbi:hypothetical protein HUX57_00130 [Arcobacter butzleri]|uniref:hypothetical protein n=1 Tax=Aliarcobacter butzleri TaxID=28197 RepID=UPI000DB68839|nr:hypothetical protein [Aliarcobacter butzleri]MCG3686472.1 hypothetical protein [Aliarcobacter butzleri]MCG3711521.1 hypothetical protein [Aliarcobacter butzleri]MCG3713972.1 hypothetical protein [Aliarcobacter butzleri]MCT7592421.1 hypothetical protein [Aliarcobacter butzleri]NUW25084.1 hypothetical protein [Aliarcobacter butzleri]
MHFDTKNTTNCDFCNSRMKDNKSFNPILKICSQECLESLFSICNKIKITDKDLKKILLKPKFKTKKLRKKIAKKNNISKKILNFEIESKKHDFNICKKSRKE